MRCSLLPGFRSLSAALLLVFSLPARAQVQETRNEYSHTFSYTPPGDTVRRVLRFHMTRNTQTGVVAYNYRSPIYDREQPGQSVPRPALAGEVAALEHLLRTALQAIPATDTLTFLSIGGPYSWADVLARQVALFGENAEWDALLLKKASERNTYEATRRIMLKGRPYAVLEPVLAKYGYAITGYHCAKISHLRRKELAALGVAYGGKTPIPVPNEFGIYLRKKVP